MVRKVVFKLKKFKKLESGHIELETLLSSRTYFNNNGFNCCIYCDKEVESDDWWIFRDEYVAPTRCDCEFAVKELECKAVLIEELGVMDEYVDSKDINQKVLKAQIENMKEEFEEFEFEMEDCTDI